MLQNNEGTDEGSLHKLLSRCITPFGMSIIAFGLPMLRLNIRSIGKRLFRIWLCVPLRDVKDINDR